MTGKLIAVGFITLALTSSAIPLPRPHEGLLNELLDHPLPIKKDVGSLDLPLLRGIKPSRIIKKDLLGPLDDALAPILKPVTDITSDTLSPVTGPLGSVTGPLGSVLGVDIDLLTPTDLLCAKVDGEFAGKAYALGCVCLGQDGLLLTADAGVQVVDGLVDWVTAQVDVSGFNSQYPEYSIPTCERRPDDDGGDFRCPLGKERKANGKCAAIFLASTPTSSASAMPTVNQASAPAPTSSAGPSNIAVNPSAPAPSPAVSAASAPTPSPSDAPVNIASTPTDDGEDGPYCDEEASAPTGDTDGNADDGDGEWVQVQSVTSTQTVTIPATAYIQQATVTETVTSTSTSTVTSTSTSTSTSTTTVTQTSTETVHDCEQSFAAAAVPPPPAPSRTPSSSVPAVSSSLAVGVASAASPVSSQPVPTSAPTPAPISSAPTPTSSASSDDGGAQISVARLNARPHPSSSAAPPCPSGEVMGATRCCPVDTIDRDGQCGCNDGYQLLVSTCVKICLPPLTLVDGACVELDLGVASDVVDTLGLGDVTKDLGLGDGLAGLL